MANDQRQIVYSQRKYLLEEEEITETIAAIRADVVNAVIDEHIPPQTLEEQWDISTLEQRLENEFAATIPINNG